MREFPKRIKDAVVSVRNSSPIPGLGVAGGFKFVVETAAAMDWWPCKARPTS